jgi:hypothetical protein
MRCTPARTAPGPPSIELGPAPEDSGAFITKRLGSSLKIPETPAVALEKMRHEEDNLSDDCNTPFSFMWTLVDGA